MDNVQVHAGSVGVGRSNGQPYVLLQVENPGGMSIPSRAILTEAQAEMLINDIWEQLYSIRRWPTGLADPEFRKHMGLAT